MVEKILSNGTFKLIRAVGFPIVAAVALFALVVWQQKQLIAVTDRAVTAIENNTKALTIITIRGNFRDGR